MTDPLIATLLTLPCMRAFATGKVVRNERGEGVISVAIAVLIVAVLGGVMYLGFKQLWGHAKTSTDNQITNIEKNPGPNP